jgi:hypothetical protein
MTSRAINIPTLPTANVKVVMSGSSVIVALFFGIGYGIYATTIGFVFYQMNKSYLNARTLKVPEVCPECKADLHLNDLKWIEPEKKAECLHC